MWDKNSSVAGVNVNNTIAIWFFHTKELEEVALLVRLLINIRIVNGNSWYSNE